MGCAKSTQTKNQELKVDNLIGTQPTRDTIPERQELLIKKSWRLLAVDMTSVGSKIFLKIFQMNPRIKLLFPFSNLEGDELLKDVTFKSHSSRFMQAVDVAVNSINNWDSLFKPLLHGLGKQHSTVKGFKCEYIDVFRNAIVCVWREELGDEFSKEIKQAWENIFNIIMNTLKGGFIEDTSPFDDIDTTESKY